MGELLYVGVCGKMATLRGKKIPCIASVVLIHYIGSICEDLETATSCTTHARLGLITYRARLHRFTGATGLGSYAASQAARECPISFGVHASHADAAYAMDAD
jgi:hypothetical protein